MGIKSRTCSQSFIGYCKREWRRGASLLMAIMLVVGTLSVPAQAATTVSGDVVSEMTLTFGTQGDVDASTLYDETLGYGFSDVAYPNEAEGWSGAIYVPRVVTVTPSAASHVANGDNYIEVSSEVWTETESTGYGVFTYENTSTLDFSLDNADYNVSVVLVNPTEGVVAADLEAEDITKASGITVAAGAEVTESFTTCLIDGTLNLKFLETSGSATSEADAVSSSVYVSQVTIERLADNTAGDVPTVYIASDSTVQTYEDYYYPQTGWGQVLYNFFDGAEAMVETEAEDCGYSQAQVYTTSSAVVENRSIGGRSSKSFVEEGKLDDLLEDIKVGDYLLIQWGHNDATYSRPNRYVSSEDFGQWVQYYIDGAKQRGAVPILVTPVARYSPNDDGTFNISFNDYRQVMLTMGAEQDVPVVDLGKYSSELCEQFGIEGAKVFFLKLAAGETEGAYAGGVNDSTHLQYYGAYKFAQIVANQIKISASSQLADLQTRIMDIQIPENVPAVPEGLETTTIGASSVSFGWEGTEGAELYYIYRAVLEEGQTEADVDFTDAEKYSVSVSNKYTDSNCEGGVTYVYAVAGFNEKGVGDKSELLTVTTKSSLYKYDFSLSASDPVMDGWIGVHAAQSYTEEAGYGWTEAPGNGRYRGNNGNADSNDMTDDFCLGAGTFAVDLPNGDYELKITACDLLPGTSTIKPGYSAEGESIGTIACKQSAGTLSATVRVADGQLNLTVGGTNQYINGLEITPLSLAPANLVYQELTFDGSQANFLLNWGDAENAISYNVYVKSATDTSYEVLQNITQEYKDNATTLPFAAILGETYSYYVTAVHTDGSETAPSNTLTIEMIDKDALPPMAPENVSVTESTRANMVLTWDSVEGAIKYNVYRSDRAEGQKGYEAYEKIGEATEVGFVDSDEDITANVHWYYKVQAVSSGGAGDLSEAAVSQITESLTRQVAEHLSDRGLYAIDLSSDKGAETRVTSGEQGVYLSWRLFEADGSDTTFTIYKNDAVIISDLSKTNYIDTTGTASDVYEVVGSSDNSLGLTVVPTTVWGSQYQEFELNKPEDQVMPDGTVATYTANDMSVGDLDGDGQYELIVKWYPSNAKDNSQGGYTGTTILDGYDLNMNAGTATQMWRIDLGINIRSGAHYTQFQVWDMDGDGTAEILCKTADGSMDGLGNIIGDMTQDYRNDGGYVLDGPEYMSIFSGVTGEVLDTTDYLPGRGNVSAWGDAYGNRVDRFLSGIAYLDGENPYAVFTRGYYTRAAMTAYGFENGELFTYWLYDTDEIVTDEEVEAQGNHGLSINDVDHDGKDEIIFGAMTIDHDGTTKYTTELGHGDAMHVSDWIPTNSGLEIMGVHEHTNVPYHVEIHDAETGEVLIGYYTGQDTGRGVAADIDPNYIGGEFWSIAGPTYLGSDEPSWDSTDGGLFSTTSTMEELVLLSEETPASNFSILWDGDLLSEVFDHSFNKVDYYPISINVKDWDYENDTNVTQLESTEVLTSNGTKGNAGLVADVMGDWREEIIARCADDDSNIRIYATTIETEYALPTLMEDDDYRMGVAWQNVGYNQPANTSYLISEGVVTAKLTEKATTSAAISFLFTEASDGTYGHEIEGYEIYRAQGDGAYELIDSVPVDALVEADANGDAIVETEPVEYYFDFGSSSNVQDGWIDIGADADSYEVNGSYGFTEATLAIGDPTFAEKSYSVSDSELASMYNDCLLGWNATASFEFKVAVPEDGEYEVTFYSLNGSGTQYNQVNIEGTDLADIRRGSSSISEMFETVTVTVTDGVLDISNHSSKSGYPPVYFSGLSVVQVVDEVPAPVESDAVLDLYTDQGLLSNTVYSYKVAAIVDGKTSFMSEPLTAQTFVEIVSIVDFDLADIVQDTPLVGDETVADLLMSQVPVVDSEGQQVVADVVWDVSNVDLATPGIYTVTGQVAGYDTPIEKSLTVLENIITGYDALGIVYAVVGTEALLPETVTVNYLNGTSVDETIVWDKSTLDEATIGVYEVEGASDSILNLAITVEMKNNYIISVADAYCEVALNGEVVLPQTVTATYADGDVQAVPVVWTTEGLDATVLGTYQLSGSVADFAELAVLNAQVVYEAIYKFDFGITSSTVADGWIGISVNPKGGTATVDDLGLTYSDAVGYGFTEGGNNIQGRLESYTSEGILPSDVYTDFAIPDGNTFAVAVENGTYLVEIIGGSGYKSRVKGDLESIVAVSVANSAGSYTVTGYEVEVTDGLLELNFATGSISRFNGFVVRKVTTEAPVEVTYSVVEFDLDPIAQDVVMAEGETLADLLPATLDVIDSNGVVTTTEAAWNISLVDMDVPGDYLVTATIEAFDLVVEKILTILEGTVDDDDSDDDSSDDDSDDDSTGDDDSDQDNPGDSDSDDDDTDGDATWYVKAFDLGVIVEDFIFEDGETLVDLLPDEVIIIDPQGTQYTTDAAWDISLVNLEEPGSYDVTLIVESYGLVVTKALTVIENYVLDVEDTSVSVKRKKSVSLPTMLTALFANGAVEEVAVDWQLDDFDTNTVGTYTIYGVVEDYSDMAEATVTVTKSSSKKKNTASVVDTTTPAVEEELAKEDVVPEAALAPVFADIDESWAKEYIMTLAKEGIITGVTETSFAPKDKIKRADFVKLLVGEFGFVDEGAEAFDDVTAEDYFYGAVMAARYVGIIKGDGDNFQPMELLTRQDMMVMVYRALTAAEITLSEKSMLTDFTDTEMISDYAKESISLLVGEGIIEGSEGKLNPLGELTREEAAKIIYELMLLQDAQVAQNE